MSPPSRHAVAPPEWSSHLAIYEVNLRQYTEAGTISAFARHLPRLAELGVGILWFMPIHPIGREGRKGTLGSYYAVADYRNVNPEYGTLEEFRDLVSKAHDLGLYVILDWVANHTARDCGLLRDHPEWYARENGALVTPEDWTDTWKLDYDQRGLRDYMIESMSWWVEDVGVDGFRCDVADLVPLDFWQEARRRCDAIRPLFWLAECETPEYHDRACDMTYAWNLHRAFNDVAAGTKTAAEVGALLRADLDSYPRTAYRMQFTSNHDENSWNGSAPERLGPGTEMFAVLTWILPGMPLIYSGQEAGLDRRLAFFEPDAIEWREHRMTEIYSRLGALKRELRVLWNGAFGGETELLDPGMPAVLAVRRSAGIAGHAGHAVGKGGPAENTTAVVGLFCLSGEPASVSLSRIGLSEKAIDLWTGNAVTKSTLELGPWGYRLLADPTD